MITRSLIPFIVLLGVSGCSTAITSLSPQPASTSVSSILKTPTPKEFGTLKVVEVSNQVVIGDTKSMKSLESYQWKNRLLLVFAPSENSAAYQQQMQLFQGQQAGFNERDLVIYELLDRGGNRANVQSIDREDAAKIRDRFQVSPGEFRVVLVGKDGTSKRRDQSPVSPTVIFKEIDVMPMRRQEMKLRRS